MKINIKIKNRSKNRKIRGVHMKKGYIIKKMIEKKSITR